MKGGLEVQMCRYCSVVANKLPQQLPAEAMTTSRPAGRVVSAGNSWEQAVHTPGSGRMHAAWAMFV